MATPGARAGKSTNQLKIYAPLHLPALYETFRLTGKRFQSIVWATRAPEHTPETIISQMVLNLESSFVHWIKAVKCITIPFTCNIHIYQINWVPPPALSSPSPHFRPDPHSIASLHIHPSIYRKQIFYYSINIFAGNSDTEREDGHGFTFLGSCFLFLSISCQPLHNSPRFGSS